MDANFEMGPRWIFFTDGPFLTISHEITNARFVMAEIEKGRETGNYLVIEKLFREKLGVFLRFITFFLPNVFLTKIIYPRRKTLLEENFVQQNFFLKIQ